MLHTNELDNNNVPLTIKYRVVQVKKEQLRASQSISECPYHAQSTKQSLGMSGYPGKPSEQVIFLIVVVVAISEGGWWCERT